MSDSGCPSLRSGGGGESTASPSDNYRPNEVDAVPCIVCRAPLRNAVPPFDGNANNQPSGGTEFSTPGHYGSTVFDPMDGSWLAINVCDHCLRGARDARLVLRWSEDAGYTLWPPAVRPSLEAR